jgi:hypothetical protein
MKHELQRALESSGPWKLRNYSGRGQYGKTCLAVELGEGQLGEVMADLMMWCGEQNGSDACYETAHAISQAVKRMKTDSMGLGSVLYFPGVSFEADGKTEVP